MSDTPPITAAVMPLFYKRVVALTPAQHGGLRLDRTAGHAFAATAQTVPLGLGEFPVASQHYPIVFAGNPVPTPVALLGVAPGANLFVDAYGKWSPDAYIPAYVRAFPFILVEESSTRTLHLAMEPDAASLSHATGQPLFEDGKPTPSLNEAMQFCSSYRDNALAATSFARAMDAAGLLQEEEATINFTAGGGTRIRGFKTIKPERLDSVGDEQFLEWRRRGWLGLIYAHVHSTGRWGRLIERAAARPPE